MYICVHIQYFFINLVMSSLQEQVNEICSLADAVVREPSKSIESTALQVGVSSSVMAFATSGIIAFFPFIGLGPIGVFIFAAKKILKKKKEERLEKERMLREVIRKQQVVINRLNQELEKCKRQNAQNREEIKNLKAVLDMLEKTEEHLKAA